MLPSYRPCPGRPLRLPFRCARGERHPGDFARPRKHEIAAAINRLRTLRIGR
ncbi:MAG: hypothetical protein ABII00_07425 [Elusimicrobiota bacterium]